MGAPRVLDVAVAPTVGPKEFTAFFESALADAIHRNQAALAPVERGHIGGAFRKIPRVHHAA